MAAAARTLISELGPATLFSDGATDVASRAASFVAAYAVAEAPILGSLDGHVANFSASDPAFPSAVARAAVVHLLGVFGRSGRGGDGSGGGGDDGGRGGRDAADAATASAWGRALPLLAAAF